MGMSVCCIKKPAERDVALDWLTLDPVWVNIRHWLLHTVSTVHCSLSNLLLSLLISPQGYMHRGGVKPVSISPPGLVSTLESHGEVLHTCCPAPDLPQPHPEDSASTGSCNFMLEWSPRSGLTENNSLQSKGRGCKHDL